MADTITMADVREAMRKLPEPPDNKYIFISPHDYATIKREAPSLLAHMRESQLVP